MLTIKKELDLYDFIDEFEMLENMSFENEREALGIIFDFLSGLGDDMDYMEIKDYIRFQVQEMDADYFIEQYGHLLKLDDDADDDEKHEEIERVLNYYTNYLGSYEYNGQTYYLFDEF